MKFTSSINKNRQFKWMYRRASQQTGRFLIMYYVKNRLSVNRLGITVSKKVGKAVVRNRIRRLIKENYTLFEPRLKLGYDLIFVSRMVSRDAGFYDVKKAMEILFKQAGMI